MERWSNSHRKKVWVHQNYVNNVYLEQTKSWLLELDQMDDQNSHPTMPSQRISFWKRKTCEAKMKSTSKLCHWKNLSKEISKAPSGDLDDVHIKSGVSISSLTKTSVSKPSFISFCAIISVTLLQLFVTPCNKQNFISSNRNLFLKIWLRFRLVWSLQKNRKVDVPRIVQI